MIGHNNGPPLGDIADVGGVARQYYWRKAHRRAWRTPPVEIVRLRDRAAQSIGLSYKDYTAVLLDRGRRPSAVFFDLTGALLRTRNNAIVTDGGGNAMLMPGVARKLQRLDCALFIVARSLATRPTLLDGYIDQVNVLCGERVSDRGIFAADPTEAIRILLNRHHIPPSQAVLVADSSEAESAAATLGLARFLWAWHYFGEALGTA